MTRPDLAALKRQLRTQRRQKDVLAGGWGRAPQEAAWDALFPDWRELIKLLADRPAEVGYPARGAELSKTFQRLPKWVRRPWYRLLMQNLHRHHDECEPCRAWGRWGGYPI